MTRVSPCLPTMMLPGLMSRCSTPRAWAYSIALQTSRNRRRSLRRASDRARVVPQGFVGMESLDGLLEALPPNEPHGIEGTAVGVGSQAVDRDDPRMFEPPGDLGLEQESLATHRVVGVLVQDPLQCHLAMQLAVQGHEHGTQAATGVRTEYAEPLALGGRAADSVAGGAVDVPAVALVRCAGSRTGAGLSERSGQIGIGQRLQLLAGRTPGWERCEALLGAPTVFSQEQSDGASSAASWSLSKWPWEAR